MIPLSWYLILAALLFGIGLFGVLARKNVIAILLGIELMLNAVNINLLAFWRYFTPEDVTGQIFTVAVFVVAAAEVAVGLGLVLQIQRRFKTLDMDQATRLRG